MPGFIVVGISDCVGIDGFITVYKVNGSIFIGISINECVYDVIHDSFDNGDVIYGG